MSDLVLMHSPDEIVGQLQAEIARTIGASVLPIADGKIHRCRGQHDARGERSAWYLFFMDKIPSAVWGDWHDASTVHRWHAELGRDITPEERGIMQRRMDEARERAEHERIVRQLEAADRAQEILETSEPCTSHPYLEAKGVPSHDLCVADDGRLIIPMLDSDGIVQSLQYIGPDGTKRYLPGGKTSGGSYIIPGTGHILYIAEGYATAATVHQATGSTVYIAFSANNLKHVFEQLKSSKKRIIIAADNDASGTGERAARDTGCEYVMPPERGDWNDMSRQHGLDWVSARLIEHRDTDGLESLEDYESRALATARRRASGEERPIPVPWAQLSEAMAGGIWPGMHMIASGTGAGKSQYSMELALCAARAGHPVLLVNMELDAESLYVRALGHETGTMWSRYLTGRANDTELARADSAALTLRGLPIHTVTADPGRYDAAQLRRHVHAMRARYPGQLCMVIVDYLQLTGGPERELRERIGAMAYEARIHGRDGMAMLLISSIARDKYQLMGSAVETAGIDMERGRRVIRNPDSLVGVGKESGETEFAADTLTVLTKLQRPLDNGERCVIAAVAKIRYSYPSWSALAFDGGRYTEYSVTQMSDLPLDEPRRHRGRPVASDSSVEADVRLYIQRHPGEVTSANQLRGQGLGTNAKIKPAIEALISKGEIELVDGKLYSVGPNENDIHQAKRDVPTWSKDDE